MPLHCGPDIISAGGNMNRERSSSRSRTSKPQSKCEDPKLCPKVDEGAEFMDLEIYHHYTIIMHLELWTGA